MKKLNQFTKSERIITLISIIWLTISFVFGINESRGDYNEEFFTIFLITGVIPVLLIVGIKWIISAGKS